MSEIDITRTEALQLCRDYIGGQWLDLTESDIELSVLR